MFKLLKSKKGFTLVELMIVVVIMAILVAVAVPIFSAVTANAKRKTCAGNRRELVAQLNNYAMGSFDGTQHIEDMNFTIVSDGDRGRVGDEIEGISSATVNKLFHELPYCPSGEADAPVTYEIKVEMVTGGNGDPIAKVTVECDSPDDHK